MVKLNVLHGTWFNAPKAIIKNNGLVAAIGGSIIWSLGALASIVASPSTAKFQVAEMWVVTGIFVVLAAFVLDRR
jgi:hypothetical protein